MRPGHCRIVVGITITYNVVEAMIAIAAGSAASAAALIGFGLDSIVEVLTAGAIAWQFAAPDPEKREKVALRVIACFAIREGLQAWKGESRAVPISALTGERAVDGDHCC